MSADGLGWSSSEDQIDFFFTAPTVSPDDHRGPRGQQSVLYLLRREVQDCLFVDPNRPKLLPEGEATRLVPGHRLFAGAMVMFAGIDLLAKFEAGDDAGNRVRERFVRFARSYLRLTEDEAEVLYTVRNALMHAFGLYDRKTHRNLALVQDCRNPDSDAGPVSDEPGVWELCVRHLYATFVRGIKAYEGALRGDPDLQVRFGRLFPRYGWLSVHEC